VGASHPLASFVAGLAADMRRLVNTTGCVGCGAAAPLAARQAFLNATLELRASIYGWMSPENIVSSVTASVSTLRDAAAGWRGLSTALAAMQAGALGFPFGALDAGLNATNWATGLLLSNSSSRSRDAMLASLGAFNDSIASLPALPALLAAYRDPLIAPALACFPALYSRAVYVNRSVMLVPASVWPSSVSFIMLTANQGPAAAAISDVASSGAFTAAAFTSVQAALDGIPAPLARFTAEMRSLAAAAPGFNASATTLILAAHAALAAALT
jgi:hypothetical protein